MSGMASIVSSLGDEKEEKLQKFFDTPVRFHLLYKSSHHGAQSSQLFSSFDNSGKFLLTVFPQSGSVRGVYLSKSLKHGKDFSDAEAFVFELTEHDATQFPVINPAKVVVVSNQQNPVQSTGFVAVMVSSQISTSISFGNCLKLKSENGFWYVSFCTDETFGTTWPQENNICCVNVELHRVQDVVGVLPTPWREVTWTDMRREELKQEFVSFKLPSTYPVSQVKALLLGPVGSGKSCLINSIRSTMYKRIVHLPNVGTAANGFTKKLSIYDIHGEKGGSPTVLSLCDVLALGDDEVAGLCFSDALAVIKGHVQKGYKFQSDSPITDAINGYKANPSLNEQTHCVLFTLDAFKMTSYPSSLKSTLRKLNTMLSDLGIPQLILLTHVDQVCPAVQDDLKYIYSSRTVKDKVCTAYLSLLQACCLHSSLNNHLVMASIVSSLGNEKETRLRSFFSTPVRFHVLYKSSHHGVQSSQLLSSFDTNGKFLLVVFLQSGSVRGAFMSKSLKYGTDISDPEAFVFEINEHDATQFPVMNPAKAVTVINQQASTGYHYGSSQSPVCISFGNNLNLKLENGSWNVSFCTDVTYGTTWAQENNIYCVDVELHHVQDVADVLPTPWNEVSWTDTQVFFISFIHSKSVTNL